MDIPEVIVPGSRLEWPDAEVGWEFRKWLDLLRSSLFEAALALHYFELATSGRDCRCGGSILLTLPNEIQAHAAVLHAKSFISAVDEFERCLRVMSTLEGAPEFVTDAVARIAHAFPNLRKIRNSTQHLEERAQRLRNGKKPIDVRPFKTESIDSASGALVLGNLDGNRFGCTMDNGEFGEQEVSAAALKVIHEALVCVVTGFRWSGPPERSPSRL